MHFEGADRSEDQESEKSEREKGNQGAKQRNHEDKVVLLDELHVSKRTLWMMAGGAMGALAVLGFGKAFELARPVAVATLKEGYGFKEWLAGKIESAKEDIEDVLAEAVYSYQKDAASAADTVKREQEILEKVEKLVEERLARAQAERKEE